MDQMLKKIKEYNIRTKMMEVIRKGYFIRVVSVEEKIAFLTACEALGYSWRTGHRALEYVPPGHVMYFRVEILRVCGITTAFTIGKNKSVDWSTITDPFELVFTY